MCIPNPPVFVVQFLNLAILRDCCNRQKTWKLEEIPLYCTGSTSVVHGALHSTRENKKIFPGWIHLAIRRLQIRSTLVSAGIPITSRLLIYAYEEYSRQGISREYILV
jgi:hypothetical protein